MDNSVVKSRYSRLESFVKRKRKKEEIEMEWASDRLVITSR